MQTSSQPELSWREHFSALYRLGLPMVGAQMAQMAINATDIAMVGRIGAAELAATALAANFFFVVYIFGSGFLVALSPIIAQAVGGGDERAVRRAVRMGLWFALFYGVVAIPVLLATQPIMLALGQDAALSATAGAYMNYACLGVLPALVFVTFRSFLGAIGRANILLWVSIGAVLVNAGLNWVLIYGNLGMPAFGVPGAAIASVATNVFLVASLTIYVLRDKRAAAFQVFVRFWRADWPVLGASLALGLPISLTVIAEVGLFQVATLMAGWLGVVPLAAHSIVMQLISFSFMVPLGLSHAATVRVGHAVGAGRLHGCRTGGTGGALRRFRVFGADGGAVCAAAQTAAGHFPAGR
ncbi:MAG: MATE family efflux transporter [Phyllobacteriaceae bacterium]|nr:MATE family efflux transporter [Phyllobacteriaceae bacterium]